MAGTRSLAMLACSYRVVVHFTTVWCFTCEHLLLVLDNHAITLLVITARLTEEIRPLVVGLMVLLHSGQCAPLHETCVYERCTWSAVKRLLTGWLFSLTSRVAMNQSDEWHSSSICSPSVHKFICHLPWLDHLDQLSLQGLMTVRSV